MSSIKTILVPLDFSEISDRALSLAIELSGTLGAKLHLIHALHIQSLMTPSGEWWQGVRNAALEGLEVARQQADKAGRLCTTELSDEYPVDAILAAAERAHADLIVMGTQGHTGVAHVLLGSIAERTLRQAPCPVMTLNAHAADGADA